MFCSCVFKIVSLPKINTTQLIAQIHWKIKLLASRSSIKNRTLIDNNPDEHQQRHSNYSKKIKFFISCRPITLYLFLSSLACRPSRGNCSRVFGFTNRSKQFRMNAMIVIVMQQQIVAKVISSLSITTTVIMIAIQARAVP